jgi:hypothetical protein
MLLESWIATLAILDPDALIEMEDGTTPVCLTSYRGYYEDLALDYNHSRPVTVGVLLDDARKAVGATFEGYKGGDFIMRGDTRVWVSEWGRSEGRDLTGVEVRPGGAVIVKSTLIEE